MAANETSPSRPDFDAQAVELVTTPARLTPMRRLRSPPGGCGKLIDQYLPISVPISFSGKIGNRKSIRGAKLVALDMPSGSATPSPRFLRGEGRGEGLSPCLLYTSDAADE